MPTTRINGLELFYERQGAGDRVVFTHGAWTDGRGWHDVIERLDGRFETVTWDRRGHSRSQGRDGIGSVKEDAADLAGLIEVLGGEPVHAVGNSSGGSVVLNLVAQRPDLVKTAAVHEPGPFGLLADSGDAHLVSLLERDKRLTRHVEQLIADGEVRRAAEYFIDHVAVGPGAWAAFPDELKTILETNAPTVADDLRDGWDVDSVDIDGVAATTVPLLISSGSDSPEMERATVDVLSQRLPAARIATVSGAGHIPHRTHPDRYADMVTAFFVEAVGASAVS